MAVQSVITRPDEESHKRPISTIDDALEKRRKLDDQAGGVEMKKSERVRGQRMMRGLLGTLDRFQSENANDDKVQKRAEIDRRLRQKLETEKEELRRRTNARTEENVMEDYARQKQSGEARMRTKHQYLRHTSSFLITTTKEPGLRFLPATLLDSQKSQLQEQKLEAEAEIKEGLDVTWPKRLAEMEEAQGKALEEARQKASEQVAEIGKADENGTVKSEDAADKNA